MLESVVFFDAEIGVDDKRVHDIGAVRDGREFHSGDRSAFAKFIDGVEFVCGHNIINHDLKYLSEAASAGKAIDTLYLSPLLFPNRPYHALVKDDKLRTEQANNPLCDAKKAMELFRDEVSAFHSLDETVKSIYYCLLSSRKEFSGFFDYVGFLPKRLGAEDLIRSAFAGRICQNSNIGRMIRRDSLELAYALALIMAADYHSVTPGWLERNYPLIGSIVRELRYVPCKKGCAYCSDRLDPHKKLKQYFVFDSFREYEGEPLQEKAVSAALHGKSLLAVFPTGGGKSLAFQLPAMVAGECAAGLTVVISPLQSLMKDQVDNLAEEGFADAVAINGLLSPVERSEAIGRVLSGLASLLYISPEQLRSPTIERLILSRNCVRFVIDEAHCFSSWGHDFRVDYLYIGDFIRSYQQKKNMKASVPVSCFTATAKQKVISDIACYFRDKLGVEMELFTSSATRRNLHYQVLYKETEDEKYYALRTLVSQNVCPTIVYVSRTKRSIMLADRLSRDGFPALPFNGRMASADKIANQEAFLRNEVRIIVATSAFGMGVDKKDIGLVIHYDISDSLENYVQEAGRAGRNENLDADCYVLFNDNDLDKHFILLNQMKLSISEIQQIWKAVKDMTRTRPAIHCSALEIARQAGWDDAGGDLEDRVRTAIAALENAGYVVRGNNCPRVFATSILVRDMAEGGSRIDSITQFDDRQKENAKRIMKSLISSRSKSAAGNDDPESRVDYISDLLGIPKDEVIFCVSIMRQNNLMDDSKDMYAYIPLGETSTRSNLALSRFSALEEFLLRQLSEQGCVLDFKKTNEAALKAGISGSSVKNLKTLLYFLIVKGYVSKGVCSESDNWVSNYQNVPVVLQSDLSSLLSKFRKRIAACRKIVGILYQLAADQPSGGPAGARSARKGISGPESRERMVCFSLMGIWKECRSGAQFGVGDDALFVADVEDALLYLSKIGALRLEGGFLVTYNAMQIRRLVLDNKIKYKKDDYKSLDEFYKMRMQQIHIVGEYANLVVRDYDAAMRFVSDYFLMDYKQFISKYFNEERQLEIQRNITPSKYRQIFHGLSEAQLRIINDDASKLIVVAAGPGSGKTMVLVHKLASLLLLEDVKAEQLLMLTFSRAAATEFKKRLHALIGNAVGYVEIKTFHSFAFDCLGRPGNLQDSDDVVREATRMIIGGEAENGRISKSVLVIDEAQDMDADELALVKAIAESNDDMRIIAVGDDDQNIYEFRGSSSANMRLLSDSYEAARYDMTENYRSAVCIVDFANAFARRISGRLKSSPLRAVRQDSGEVVIIRHSSYAFERCIADDIAASVSESGAVDDVAVLTNTNEEAMRIVGLLLRNGINAKLIQSSDDFRLYNLAEVRYFLKSLADGLDRGGTANVSGQVGGRINDGAWESAKRRLEDKYVGSECLDNMRNLFSEYEAVASFGKYFGDFEEFLKESKYEDFYTEDSSAVVVSTIHKAKGREFKTVYLALSGEQCKDDEAARKLFVGITRAKDRLFVHCNTGIFDEYAGLNGVRIFFDGKSYSEPEEIVCPLSLKDVNLGFYKDRKGLIFRMRSGMRLQALDDGLFATIDGADYVVAKYSKAFSEKLSKLMMKGYRIKEAKVGFVVAWKSKDAPESEEESAVLLPELRLAKRFC